jgi:hypothetical protein
MNGKFNINIEEMKKSLREQGEKDRELFEEFFIKEEIVWTEDQLEKIKIAAKILTENKKECEKFKDRGGI